MMIYLRSKKGFTLIELLIVIAIITILATFLIPSIGSGRERARQAKCLNNVRVLLTQALLKSESYTGKFNGYPQYLGTLFPIDGDLDIDAADCPSTQQVPTVTGSEGNRRIQNGDYLLVQYSGVQPGTYPYIYDKPGNHSAGQNCGYIAGNVKFSETEIAPPNGESTTPE